MNSSSAGKNGAGRDPAPALPDEVAVAAAPPEVATVWSDIAAVLRVPFVDQLWRVLAGRPVVLQEAWGWLAPLLGSMEAEQAAVVLRREAVIPVALGLPAHKAFRGDMSRTEIGADDRERISNYTMAMHYVLPKLLLATALLTAELRSPRQVAPAGGGGLQPLPRGVAQGAPAVNPMDPQSARGEIPGLFAEIRERHGYAPIADYYRGIAWAGDFLRVAWNPLRPIVGDPEYLDRARVLARRAQAEAATLRGRASGAPPLARTAGDAEWLTPILTFHGERLLPEMLVELTIIKGLLDGPDTAAENRYSLADTGGT